MNIIVMGPAGSGKSTQAKKIAHDLGLLYVSTGQIIRDLVETEDPMGAEVKGYVEKGKWVPDDLMNEIILSWLDAQDLRKGVVLDGYPRRLDQAKILETKILIGQKIDWVFLIDLPKEEILKRLRKRAKLENRIDETPQAIASRLEEYQELTTPILDFYKKRGILIKIDGLNSIDEVHRNLISQISIRQLADKSQN